MRRYNLFFFFFFLEDINFGDKGVKKIGVIFVSFRIL